MFDLFWWQWVLFVYLMIGVTMTMKWVEWGKFEEKLADNRIVDRPILFKIAQASMFVAFVIISPMVTFAGIVLVLGEMKRNG